MRPIQYASNDILPARAAPSQVMPEQGRPGMVSKVVEFGLASLGTFAIVWMLSTVTVLMIAR